MRNASRAGYRLERVEPSVEPFPEAARTRFPGKRAWPGKRIPVVFGRRPDGRVLGARLVVGVQYRGGTGLGRDRVRGARVP